MSRIITTAEVKKHNHKDSVWMIIHNDVYDVTNFLDEHPGGEETLLDSAGKEASQDFEDVGHSEDARELMKKYKIGTLPAEEHNQAPTQPLPAVVTCSNLKWYILALLGAIVIGVVIKKKLAA
ncbi:cytochrome b5-like isoform X1 [Choristoneura fumiferana]|uniref:cytochrome b5-like isoform X1 n=1 Tax=Choristoneura fumiferana TaxID=7141 RepID=UPI003D154827